MGVSTSRLRRIFSHAIQVTSLSAAFNLALVADGIRPSYRVPPSELGGTQKVIDLYGTKVLSVKGDGLVVGTHNDRSKSLWPSSSPGSLTTSVDSNLFYHMDAFILCHDSKTKQDSGAIFYSFDAPEPLSHTSQTNLYHSMLKAYTLARRLSSSADDGLMLRIDVAYHKVLSPTTVHSLMTTGMTAHPDLLLAYLRENGFGPVADALQAKPHLLASEAFRQGALRPLFTFEQSGVLSSLNLTHAKREDLQAQTEAWSQALLSGA